MTHSNDDHRPGAGPAVSRRTFLQGSAAAAAGIALGANATAAETGPAAPRPKPRWRAQPFVADRVRLLDGPFLQARERDRRYLMSIPNARLLHSFRLTAGLPSSAQPLGGWESPHCELRGHFSGGHYLSACALLYAATADGAVLDKANALVDALAECQRDDGYLGAYPASFYDRLGRGENVWVPIYTCDKIIAGHLAMAVHCGNRTALRTATRMADWLGAWMDGFDDAAWERILGVEFGGIGETLLNLHEVTGADRHRRWALRFDHARLLEPLAEGRDALAGLHANTQIPKVIAAARAWEAGAGERYRQVAGNFWRIVTDDHAYCTGGTSDYEHWAEPGRFAGRLSGHSHESCCSHNMLRLTRHLYGWEPDAALMDYYERVLFNARLGTQDDAGMMMYFVPMDAGYWKTYNTPFDSFWCCTGTGVEEFARSNDTIYFHDGDSLFVNLFIASELSWPEQGLRLRQTTRFPDEEGTTLAFDLERPRQLEMRIRIPDWAAGATLKINGQAQALQAAPGSYLVLDRRFEDGDRIELGLPMALHAAPLPDEPSLQAMMYGPLVLAARLGREGIDPDRVRVSDPRPSFNRLTGTQLPSVFFEPDESWVRRSGEGGQVFEATGIDGPLQLIPLHRIRDERYAVYCRARPAWERKPQF
ncbi:glycoside hydrolase family 127 protein [Luteimonas suaedae]|uniref:glycoside hydrolase family 127 protein n=1 Tax=Luteimonas suaedae TaxID=2605430 RepID=UPI0011EBEEDF|nr:glycoside hydrolase family 127 protein [Luteimonas suaedae]